MAKLFMQGFEFGNIRDIPDSMRNVDNKFLVDIKATLGSTLVANTENAKQGHERGGFYLISPEGVFEIEPVQGTLDTWTVKVMDLNTEDADEL